MLYQVQSRYVWDQWRDVAEPVESMQEAFSIRDWLQMREDEHGKGYRFRVIQRLELVA